MGLNFFMMILTIGALITLSHKSADISKLKKDINVLKTSLKQCELEAANNRAIYGRQQFGEKDE